MRALAVVISLGACGSAGKADPAATTPPATHWVFVDHFGIEVEAPLCDEVASIPQLVAQNVMARDPNCHPNGLAAFSDEEPTAPHTIDELRVLVDAGQKPPIIRFGTTPNGWFVEQVLGRDVYYTQHYEIGSRRFICLTSFLTADPDADLKRRICTSARPKTPP